MAWCFVMSFMTLLCGLVSSGFSDVVANLLEKGEWLFLVGMPHLVTHTKQSCAMQGAQEGWHLGIWSPRQSAWGQVWVRDLHGLVQPMHVESLLHHNASYSVCRMVHLAAYQPASVHQVGPRPSLMT